MSTSNAAPLPRLGEVFFDVRSASRTLRISWYADTGVAVLSIWQGGTCTGSFRLPMGDLPRMIETLQRGPECWDSPGQGNPPPAAEPGRAGHDPYPDGSGSLHYLNGPVPAEYPDHPVHAHYPGSLSPAHYPESRGPAHYLDQPPEPPYSGRLSETDQAGGIGHPDAPAESLAGPYPGDAGAHRDADGRSGHSPRPSGGNDQQQARVPSHRRERAGWADEQPAPGWDSGPAGHAENGLEPLPESLPYGQQHRDHELHERQPEPLRPFT